MNEINENKNYSEAINEQNISSNEAKKGVVMTRKYIVTHEKQVYQRLAILGVTTLVILVILFFWGLPVLARFAGILTFFTSRDELRSGGDVVPPFPPRLEGIPTATNSAQIKLVGFAESGSTLEIFLNGALAQKLLIDANGKFDIDNFNLTYGENKLQLKATDRAGNSSSISEQLIVFDNTPPNLELSEPKSGSVFFGQNNLIKIAGKTDPATTVLVSGFWAIVDQEGKFTLPYPAQPGENNLEIIAQDAAGNQTKQNLIIYYNP